MMNAMRLRAVALGLLAGCSSSPTTDDGSCAAGTWVGGFQINVMDSTNASPDFQGSVQERYVLKNSWRTIMSDGSCELSELEPAMVCTPSCPVGDICSFDGTCVHAPGRSVGTVRLTGWGSSPISFEPNIGELSTYYTSDPNLLDPVGAPLGPAPAPGTALALNASGGDYTPFSLTGRMITPLAFRSDAALTVRRGQSLTLEWNPPDQPGQTQIFAIVNFGASGAGTTTCTFPDTGRGIVSAPLLPSSASDPSSAATYAVTLHRYTVTSTQIAPGCVSFSINSQADQLFSLEN